jgi:hypothetical protein
MADKAVGGGKGPVGGSKVPGGAKPASVPPKAPGKTEGPAAPKKGGVPPKK